MLLFVSLVVYLNSAESSLKYFEMDSFRIEPHLAAPSGTLTVYFVDIFNNSITNVMNDYNNKKATKNGLLM